MNIKINNTPITIYDFDVKDSILRRFIIDLYNPVANTISHKYITNTIISFIRFKTNIITFEKDKNYDIDDIRSEIIDKDVKEISKKEFLKDIKSKYGYATIDNTKFLVYNLWLIEKGYSKLTLKEFVKIYNENNFKKYLSYTSKKSNGAGGTGYFKNAEITYRSMATYLKYINTQRIELKKSVDLELKVYKDISKIEPIDTTKFIVDEIIEDTTIKCINGESIYELFDMFIVSEKIPFIILFDNTINIPKDYMTIYGATASHNTMIKVYENITFNIPNYVLNEPIEQGECFIIYYVLRDINKTPNFKVEDDIENDIDIGLYYNRCVLEKNIEIDSFNEGFSHYIIQSLLTYDVTNNSDNTILSNIDKNNKNNIDILNGLSTLKFEIENVNQSSVGGKFIIPNNTLNKAIFSDMIFNNVNVSYFLYINESQKLITVKKRFVLYYNPNHLNIINNINIINNPLTITLTPEVDDFHNQIHVRVSRASSLTQVLSFQNVFSRIFGLYKQEYATIEKLYLGLYAKLNFDKYVKKIKEKKIDLKTGIRLQNLKTYNPDVFSKKYSGKCQPQRRQPYIVTTNNDKDTIKALKKKMAKVKPKELGESLSENGMLNWPKGSKDWYACYPREEDDDDKSYIFPGLIKQNNEKHPYAPCCFLSDQYKKTGGMLKKIYLIEKKEKSKDESSEELKDISLERPLGPKKLAPYNRFAELPYFIRILAISSGYSDIDIKGKRMLPFIRHGVVSSPNSFVHCMEKAFNKNYDSMSISEKNKRVTYILQKMSKLKDEDLVTAKQELYDYTYDDIRKHLATPNAYIDPSYFVHVFSNYDRYKCNIIVFKVSEKYPNGELDIPRSSIAYLQTRYNKEYENVIIIKFETKSIYKDVSRELRESKLDFNKVNVNIKCEEYCDDEDYYQCELLVRVGKNGDIHYTMKSDSAFIERIFRIIYDINIVYMISEDIHKKYDPVIKY